MGLLLLTLVLVILIYVLIAAVALEKRKIEVTPVNIFNEIKRLMGFK